MASNNTWDILVLSLLQSSEETSRKVFSPIPNEKPQTVQYDMSILWQLINRSISSFTVFDTTHGPRRLKKSV